MSVTGDKLAAALGEIPGMPASMIKRAQEGYYHDYESPLTFPLMELVSDLRDVQRIPALPANSRPLVRGMIQRVEDGEFDATKAEAEEWARSPEGQQTWRDLIGGELCG